MNTENSKQPEVAVPCTGLLGGACHATPKDELIRQLLDSRIAKTEREWAGAREIERLRGIIARNAKTRLAGDSGPLFITPDDIKDSLEILYAEMEREDSQNAKLSDGLAETSTNTKNGQ